MRIAIYLRLSRADGDMGEDGKDESNSIENQRLLLTDYISRNEELDGEVLEFVDDGYTGTNFKRPAYRSMLEEAKKGNINVLVVKDLSRIGRNYIDVGDYLEQIFPMLGVRVIAINSYYDSGEHQGSVAGLDVAITNIVNNMYSVDLSKKVKSAFRAKWKNGISTTGVMPYGYRRNPDTGERWIVDDEAADVIRRIFDRAASGWNLHMIADELNAMKIDTPNKYHRRKGTKNYYRKVSDKEDLWNIEKLREMVRRIEYAGHMANHKVERLHMGMQARSVPARDWYIIENHHTPIVSQEVFDKAQQVIKNGKSIDYRISNRFVLEKKIRCGNCGLAMNFGANTYEEYCWCSHAKSTGKYSRCSRDRVSLKHIEHTVYGVIKEWVKEINMLDGLVSESISRIIPEYEKSRSAAESRIAALKQERIRQYEAYASGQITGDEYLKKKNELTRRIEELTEAHDKADELIAYDDGLSREAKRLKGIAGEQSGSKKLTKKMVDAFIDVVYVHDKDRIEVKLKCSDFVVEAIERHNAIMDELPENRGA